jgi:hypothetical protein
VERLGHDVEDPLRQQLGGHAGAIGEHDELVAAEAGDGLALADRGAQAVGDRPQQLVAGTVAEGVVDGLEVVEVEEQGSGHGTLAARPHQELFGPVEGEHPVGEPGEAIVQRLVAQLAGLAFHQPQGPVPGTEDGDEQPGEQEGEEHPDAEDGAGLGVGRGVGPGGRAPDSERPRAVLVEGVGCSEDAAGGTGHLGDPCGQAGPLPAQVDAERRDGDALERAAHQRGAVDVGVGRADHGVGALVRCVGRVPVERAPEEEGRAAHGGHALLQ